MSTSVGDGAESGDSGGDSIRENSGYNAGRGGGRVQGDNGLGNIGRLKNVPPLLQDSSIPPLPLTVSGKVYLEPQLHSHGRFILKICNNYGTFQNTDFKGCYRTWSELTNRVIQDWFDEFEIKYCCPEESDDVFFIAFNDEFKKISNKNKRNRESTNGEACVHTGGYLNLINLLDRMKKTYGEHIDEVDALAAMHTRKGPDGRELIWATQKHEKVFNQYKEIIHEKAITEGVLDSNDASNTRLPFEGQDWEDAVVSLSEGRRVRRRGNIIFGFGTGGRPLLGLQSGRTHASSLCPSASRVPGSSRCNTPNPLRDITRRRPLFPQGSTRLDITRRKPLLGDMTET
ncbi:hypothetical protein OROMI_014546 [Orobanche minor]